MRVDVLQRRDVRKTGNDGWRDDVSGHEVRLSVVDVDDGDPTRLLNVPDRDGGLSGDDDFLGERMKEDRGRINGRNVSEDGGNAHRGHGSVNTSFPVAEDVPLHLGLHSDLVVSVEEPLATPVTLRLVVAVALFALVPHQLLREVLRRPRNEVSRQLRWSCLPRGHARGHASASVRRRLRRS